MSCFKCGDWSDSELLCTEHDNKERYLRIEGSKNGPKYSGILAAENHLLENRSGGTIRGLVKWTIESGYHKWASVVLKELTLKSLEVKATGNKADHTISITLYHVGSRLMRELWKLQYKLTYTGQITSSTQQSSVYTIEWNDWPKLKGIIEELYPKRSYDADVEHWYHIKSVLSSNPRTMKSVNRQTYTSELALNRGKICGGEFIATKEGFTRFEDMFRDSHRIGSKKVGRFGRRYRAPASIENLESIISVCEQPLDVSIEACTEIYRQSIHQRALSQTFRWRMCTKKYNEDGLHRYIYNEKESRFNPLLTEKIKEDLLEEWDNYLNIYKPYSQQKITAEASWKAKYVSWWIDMRVGKTPTALMLMNRGLRESKVDQWIVVAPAINLYDPWFTELEKQGAFRVCVLDEGSATDLENIKSEAFDVYLVSYSSLGRRLPMMHKYWGMDRVGVVMDETSLIKNHKSNRAKACIRLTEHSPYVFALNGTPLAQGPQDIFPQQMAVDQGVTFGTSIHQFYERWLEKVGPNKFRVEKNSSTLFELRLAGSSIRYIRSEADQFNRRDKNFRYVVMPNTKAQKKATKEIVLGFTRDEKDNERDIKSCILTVYGHLREVCAGYDKYEIVPDSGDYRRVRHKVDPKITWIRAFLKGNPGVPMIVFSEFSESEDRLMETLESEGILYSSMRKHGSKSTRKGQERMEEIRKFQEGETRVIIMKTVSAKGVTLNRKPAVKAGIGSYPSIVYMQPTWSLIDWEQSQDRAVGTDDRSGNSISTMIYALIIQGSIEEAIVKALRGKKNVAETLLADAARSGYSNPFEGMDLSGSDFDGDEFFDSEDMEARYALGLAPQKKLSERAILKADLKYRAKKYGTTQKVASGFPRSAHAAYLLSKHEDLPTANIEDYRTSSKEGQ